MGSERDENKMEDMHSSFQPLGVTIKYAEMMA